MLEFSPVAREWQERVNVGCARGQWESVRIAAKGPESWEEVQCAEYRLNEAAAGLRERGVEILVIDPFGPMLLSCNLSENSNDDVRCLFMALEALIARAGLLALIGTQHNGHGSTRARGASAWGDCPDLALSYDGRKLTTVKTRGAEVRCGVVWDAETQLLTLTDTVAPGTAPGEDSVKLADVLGVLTSGDPFKRGEIREALGIGVNDGRRKKALAAVVDAGAQAGFIDEEPGPSNSKICRLTETGRTHLVNLLGGVGPHLLGTHSNPLGCAGPENDLPAEVPDAK